VQLVLLDSDQVSTNDHLTVSSFSSNDRFYWRGLGDALIVVDLSVFEFTILNKTAGAVWLCLLDQDWQVSDLVDFISDSYSGTSSFTKSDLNALLETWSALGWLQIDKTGALQIVSKTTKTPPPPFQQISGSALAFETPATVLEWSTSVDFIGAAVGIKFHSDPDLANSDMSIRAWAFLNGLPQSEQCAGDFIECFISAAGIFLRQGDVCLKAADVSDGLSRLVLWCFYSAYGRDNFLGTFHAAALGSDNGAVLMPGVSGVGKSTLTAYLARNGWLYGGDDIIGLSKPTGPEREHLILPFCSAISVKNGSLDILAPYYHGLESLPLVHYDTKVARFPGVPATDQMTADPKQRRIRAIVFPAFEQSGADELTSLSVEEALLALVGVGFRTGEIMDKSLLETLFKFLEDTPKYRLSFTSLEDARDLLEGLL